MIYAIKTPQYTMFAQTGEEAEAYRDAYSALRDGEIIRILVMDSPEIQFGFYYYTNTGIMV